jgi:predicted amidohydrolase YtcJ
MRTIVIATAILVCLVACSRNESPANSQAVESPSVVADAVYTNGKIYTVNEDRPWAEAIAIKDGKFLTVGSASDVAAVTGDTTEIVDLDGRMAMPGMIDLHNHMTGASMSKANLYIENPNNQEAMLAQIKAYADANPDVTFVRGEAWNLGVFPNNSPRKEWLDEIIPDRPAYFYSQTGHEAWVNSKTLELIGIDANSEQTSLNIWDVDSETNEPTGTIREFAMSLVEQALGPTDPERLVPEIRNTLRQFSQHGFTSLKLAEGEVSWVQALNMLDAEGHLDARMFPSWFHRAHMGAMTTEESRAAAVSWEDFKSPMVYPRYVKMYMDGTPGSTTSLMFEDYEGRPGVKGSIHFPIEEFIDDFAFFNSLGLGMQVHVFGDATSLELVKAFEAVRKRNGDNGAILHFSHAVLSRPAEIERLSNISDVCMDFIALQYPHPQIESGFVPPIGEERYQTFLNARSAVEAGIPYGFGSDWPSTLEPVLNGFFQMQAWVTRRDPRNPNSRTLNVDQAITLEQAVWGYTRGGIECLGFDWPEKIGSIEEGKFADFIVIDRNIFEIPIETLKDTKVETTVVGGRVVFDQG